MNNINIVLGGLRCCVFVAAFFSACIFIQEIGTSFDLFCAIWKGRVRTTQIIGLAALGWFFLALSSMTLTYHYLITSIFDRYIGSIRFGWDAIWILLGLAGQALGFYIPVLSILWYRGKLWSALTIALFCPLVGLLFALFISIKFHIH